MGKVDQGEQTMTAEQLARAHQGVTRAIADDLARAIIELSVARARYAEGNAEAGANHLLEACRIIHTAGLTKGN